MKKALIIVGSTSTGKTSLAKKLASNFKGFVVNADSRQVYKHLDIISGKDIPPQTPYVENYYLLDRIKFFLFDLVKPSEEFSVSKYLNLAIPLIQEISEQNVLPIITGGSGFYIKALIDGIETASIAPNIELRRSLEDKSLVTLQNKLKKINLEKFEQLNNSDVNNKRRLIRAIEVSKFHHFEKSEKLEGFDLKIIGLKTEIDLIKKRIDKRIDERLGNGAFKEAKGLFENYDSLSSQVRESIGYRELFGFFKNELTLEQAIEKWRISEYQLVKKQMTWFNKEKRIEWFDTNSSDFNKKVEESVRNWYNKDNA